MASYCSVDDNECNRNYDANDILICLFSQLKICFCYNNSDGLGGTETKVFFITPFTFINYG